jgi:hypothetical protein
MNFQAFPQALTTSYVQTGSGSSSSGYSDAVTLFTPGGGETALAWQTKHNYDDIRMARIPNGAIGAMAAIGRTQGAVINPKVEVLYSHTNLRTFLFQFLLAPSSPQEGQQMVNIIRIFRKHASPVLVGESDPRSGYVGNQAAYLTSGGLFLSPSEFIIKFYDSSSGNESLTLPKIGRCVLTDVTAQYCPNGEYSTFNDGTPTSSSLQMTFQEMRIIDAENVMDGY